jgi:Protein of unknown function (DUF2637)
MNSPLPVGKWDEPTMNGPLPAPVPAPRRNWTRRVVNLLVALVVVAVAAAAFVFSYDGVHAIALLGGVSKQLARYYPGLFDAVLVIACVAAVVLRDGRWWARLWAWVVLFIVLAAIGTTDVLHAMNYALPHRPTEGVVAAAPVVAVLLAFSLLLTLLRQSRSHEEEPAAPAPVDVPALPAAVPVPPIALPAAPPAVPTAATAPTEAMPARQDWTVPDWTASAPVPVHEDRVTAGVPKAPPAAAPEPTHPATGPNEVIVPEAAPAEAPTVETSAVAEAAVAEKPPAQDEPAPPTVQVPALSAKPGPETVPVRRPPGIRYAGSGVPGMAGNQEAAGRDVPPGEDYWDSEEAGQFAGLVYPAREDQPGSDRASEADDSDRGADQPDPRKNPPELDDDAPPFATAPFASVPRLNRVRSTPAPPADEDEPQPGT